MIMGIEEILVDTEPDALLVQGDTNSVLAGSIAASKLDVELGHVEAGLRSFDREMPEETNRVLTDHAAEYLFAPTEKSADYLRKEGLPDSRIRVTGNTVVDAVTEHRHLAREKSTILDSLGVEPGEFALLTAHRAENVDEPDRFADILAGAGRVGTQFGLKIIYPIHPRAREQLSDSSISVPDCVRLIEPCDYLDFLRLEMETQLILTDSGGVQEEACILGVPCVTLRDNTERPETVDVDANIISGTEPGAIESAAEWMLNRHREWTNPFGDGTASEQIIETVWTPAPIEMSQ
jgi:UDP-N-acetylglucosamine 2-epimerase (non-hydrolysing)